MHVALSEEDDDPGDSEWTTTCNAVIINDEKDMRIGV